MNNRIVCAAIRFSDGLIITGARHYDKVMRDVLIALAQHTDAYSGAAEQGFIDKYGKFHDRKEAYKIAKAAGQIIRDYGDELYSESLY